MGQHFAGIDIGSRTIELVIVDKAGNIIENFQRDTGYNPMSEVDSLLSQVSYDAIMATGYGRNLFELSIEARTVTEIKAHARGAMATFPGARTVLDIGGQDSKVISLSETGRVSRFEMNDRCAAGTGKFLEIMAKSLGYRIEDFGNEALAAKKDITISSMCTVFAESEVTSLIGRGEDCREIALGLHDSVVRRVSGMIRRVSATDAGELVFTGGVARNPCIRMLLERTLDREIQVAEDPQLIGAYGAALLALESALQ